LSAIVGVVTDLCSGYQPGTDLVTDENGDLANFHEILDRWKNYFAQLLNVLRVNDVRQMEMHTADLLLSEPRHFEVKIAVGSSERCNSPDID
jgi:hypothetical protein